MLDAGEVDGSVAMGTGMLDKGSKSLIGELDVLINVELGGMHKDRRGQTLSLGGC